MSLPMSSSLGSQQMQEFVLYGSVLDDKLGLLHDRLLGLADPQTTEFAEQEMVFSLRTGDKSAAPVSIRLRRSLLVGKDAPWQIRYLGEPEPDPTRKNPTIVRKTVDCLAQSNNMMQFMRNIGMRMDFEYVNKGTVYTKGPMKISVSEILEMPELGDPSKTQSLNKSRLVTLSLNVPHGEPPSTASKLSDFADQLKPIVNLTKCDNLPKT